VENKKQIELFDSLKKWILQQEDTLALIVKETAEEFFNQNLTLCSNFRHDIDECNEEFFNLGKGGEAYYDRFSSGWLYSTWYHLRRVNGTLLPLADEWISARAKPQCIVDLGCGTGATLWSIGLMMCGLKRLGVNFGKMKVINLDSSPFMKEYAELLWKRFCTQYEDAGIISTDFAVRSWNSPNPFQVDNSWFYANYLFDSDADWEFLCDEFSKLVQEKKPSRVFLRTSVQKRTTVDRIADTLSKFNYTNTIESCEIAFKGRVDKVFRLRNDLRKKYNLNLSGSPAWEPNRSGEYAKVLKAKAEQSLISIEHLSIGRQINLKIDEIELNEKQRDLAKIRQSPFPMDISGAAGCGKSLVIVNAIKNLVLRRTRRKNSVLLTTFNKELIALFRSWLEILLGKEWKCHCPKENQYIFQSLKTEDKIEILHFDIIPTRIFGISNQIISDEQNESRASSAIEEICRRNGKKKSSLPKSITPLKITQYYFRYYYGNGWKTEEEFLNGQMDRDFFVYENARRMIFEIIRIYVSKFGNDDTFETRRDRCLRLISQNLKQEKFTYVFLDEFQDCSPSDLRILLGLVVSPDCITIAGDFSQAVHLGKKAQQLMAGIGSSIGLEMKKWQHRSLDGSYRLPYRISDCMKPFSAELGKSNSGNVLHSYPGGPPGARPILVYGKTTSECGKKIANAMFYYRKYSKSETRLTILEKDAKLEKSIREGWKDVIKKRDPGRILTGKGLFFLGTKCDSVLRIKGLEMPFVVWSSMKNPEEDNLLETHEFSYTAMTRTSAVLFIAASEETTIQNMQTLRLLSPNFLLTWDEESQKYLDSLKNEN
jgi:hypothetical protein